jgi:FkbM family methyltransferase
MADWLGMLRKVKPMWLREKIYYHVVHRFGLEKLSRSDSVELAFAPRVSMRLIPTDVGHRVILATGFYELSVSQRIAELAKKGGLFVDVGANYGYYSAIWASANVMNKVVAYEADSSNVARLKETMESNRLADQATIFSKAVGETKGVALFSKGPNDQTGQGGIVSSAKDGAVPVDVVSLDDEFAESHIQISVLKVDVEGADTLVLRGANRLLGERRIHNVFFEHFPERMAELGIPLNAPFDFLRDKGYLIHQLSPGEFHAVPANP